MGIAGEGLDGWMYERAMGDGGRGMGKEDKGGWMDEWMGE